MRLRAVIAGKRIDAANRTHAACVRHSRQQCRKAGFFKNLYFPLAQVWYLCYNIAKKKIRRKTMRKKSDNKADKITSAINLVAALLGLLSVILSLIDKIAS